MHTFRGKEKGKIFHSCNTWLLQATFIILALLLFFSEWRLFRVSIHVAHLASFLAMFSFSWGHQSCFVLFLRKKNSKKKRLNYKRKQAKATNKGQPNDNKIHFTKTVENSESFQLLPLWLVGTPFGYTVPRMNGETIVVWTLSSFIYLAEPGLQSDCIFRVAQGKQNMIQMTVHTRQERKNKGNI